MNQPVGSRMSSTPGNFRSADFPNKPTMQYCGNRTEYQTFHPKLAYTLRIKHLLQEISVKFVKRNDAMLSSVVKSLVTLNFQQPCFKRNASHALQLWLFTTLLYAIVFRFMVLCGDSKHSST